MRRMIRRSARSLLLIATGGCAAIHRPPATVASIRADGSAARAAERTVTDSVIVRLARRAITRDDRHLDILLLSGGGQNGAYGAGFLRGWRERTDGAMPQFDLVTGISTGALQAPFAVLGTQEALDSLAALYRAAVDRIAPTIDIFFGFRRTGGIVRTGRYEKTLRSVMDHRMRDNLRRAFGQDRGLVIGTTDFDLGIRRTWDVATELDSSSAGLARFQTLLLTTTAIPSIFPLHIVDGHVQADGGVVGNILPVLDLDGYRRLAERLRDAGQVAPTTIRVWLVMNTWTEAKPSVIDPASREAITARTVDLLFSGQQSAAVQRFADLAEAVNSGVPGLRMEFHATVIPGELTTEPGASSLFDRKWMLRVEELGYQRAQGAAPWDVIAPRS